MAKPDIEILVGIEGGGSISGASGQKIRNQIQSIIAQVKSQKNTQLKLGVDQTYINNQITNAIHSKSPKCKLKVDQTYIQNQVRNAVQSMSPVDLKVNMKPQNNGGGGGSGKNNNGLGEISQLTKEINRRELKIVGNENKSEVKELQKQIADLEKARNTAIITYQQTHNVTTQNVLDTVNKERQIANTLDAISAKASKTHDTSAFAIDKLKVKVSDYINQIEKTAKRDPEAFNDLLKFKKELTDGNWADKPREANQKFMQLQETIKKANLEQENFGQKVGRIFKEKLGYGILAVSALKARQALRQIYTNVVDIDTAMTELKKVTNETDQAYQKFLENASSRAKTLGATLSDTITATADFARLGYSMDEASQLADSALVYKNVGDGISSITDASESVISTMKAFNVEAEKSMSIVDKFNEVGNNFAISSKGVGDALLNSASALAAANNNLDESIALITAANSVVQSPDKVGTSLKTISMYLRAAKSEAEDAGESTDGMAESVSKLQKELLMLTGGKFNIMADAQTFKSTYDILKDLSKVWNQISDINQAAIIEKIGGKRQANVVSAILNNFTIAEEALATAQQSAGSALAENEKYLDSINGKLSVLKASYQELSTNILGSGFVKGIVDGITNIINLFNTLDDQTNGVASEILLVTASVATLVSIMEVLSVQLLTHFGIKMITPFAALKKMIDSLSVSFGIFKVQATTAGVGIGKAALMLLQSFGQTGILVAGVAAFVAAMIALDRYVKKAYPSLQQLSETYEDNKKELESLNSEYETTKNRITELQKLADSGTITITEEAELRRLKEQNAILEKQIKLKEQIVSEDRGKMSDAAIAAIYGGSSDVRGMATTDDNGNRIEGMKRLEVFQQDIDLYKKAKQEYADAVATNDQGAMDAAKQTMSYLEASLRSQMTSLLEDASKVDSTTEAGKNAIRTVDQAYDSFLITLGDAASAQEAFNNIIQREEFSDAVSAIQELGTQGELTTEALINLYKTNPQVRELLDYLAKHGLISLGNLTPVVNQFNIAVQKTSSSMMTLSDAIQKIDGPFKVLQKAYKETAEDGYVSIDTLEELCSKYPGLQKYLVQTANGYKLTKASLDDYLKSQKQEYEMALNDAKSAAIKVYENETGKTYAYARTTEAIKEQLRAIIKLNSVTIDTERADALNKYGNDAIGRQLATKNKSDKMKVAEAAVSSASKALAELDVAQNDIDLYNRLITTAQRDANNSVKSSGTDTYKQDIEKQIKILQHEREMDKISAEQYYDRLAEIEKKYYVDKVKYAEEIADLDQEIFNGRRDILSDWISDQEKIADTLQSSGRALSQSNVAIGSSFDNLRKKIDEYAVAWNKLNNGNVDYRKRNVFTGADLIKAGWNSAKDLENLRGADGVTTYTQGFYGEDFSGSIHKKNLKKYIEITPILDNGTILSPSALKEYVEKIFKSADVLSADKIENGGKGLIVSIWDDPSDKDLNTYFDKLQTVKDAHLDAYNDLQDQIKNSSITNAEDVYRGILAELEKMIADAYAYNLDENSDYVQELRDQYKKTCQDILNLVQGSYDDFMSYADDFDLWGTFDFSKIEYLEKNLNAIKKLYKEGILGWKEYVDAYNKVAKQIYDTKKESIETIIDLTMEMIEQEKQDEIDALDDQIDKFSKIIDLKKKMLQDTKNEADHEEQVADAVKEISKLQSKISQLSLDNSRESIAKRTVLEEQLAEKQRELAKLQRDYQIEQTLDTLDETENAKKEAIEDEKKEIEESIDTWQKKYDLAIKRINKNWEKLGTDLTKYMDKHRTSIDGPNSLKTAWQNVDDMVNQTKTDIERLYAGISAGGINPNGPESIITQTNPSGGGTANKTNSGSTNTNQPANSNGPAYNATYQQYGAEPSATLKIGSSGDGVKWLQFYLKQLGYFPYDVDGTFYTRTASALKDFQRMAGLKDDGIYGPLTRAKLKKYHTGGIVDSNGALNDKEVLAILQRGELVLDDKKKMTLKSILSGLKATISSMTNLHQTPYQHRLAAVGGYGDTFAPQVSVSISHNGNMTDRDAKRYGDLAADAALEKLRTAFNKRGIS